MKQIEKGLVLKNSYTTASFLFCFSCSKVRCICFLKAQLEVLIPTSCAMYCLPLLLNFKKNTKLLKYIMDIKKVHKLLGWLKSLLLFFYKIKDIFFIFINNFIDLDILSMLAISHYRFLVGRGQRCC